MRGIAPSQPSGSVLAARSSIENLTSTPFSIRDSGSAFMSQYWLSSSTATFSLPSIALVSPPFLSWTVDEETVLCSAGLLPPLGFVSLPVCLLVLRGGVLLDDSMFTPMIPSSTSSDAAFLVDWRPRLLALSFGPEAVLAVPLFVLVDLLLWRVDSVRLLRVGVG